MILISSAVFLTSSPDIKPAGTTLCTGKVNPATCLNSMLSCCLGKQRTSTSPWLLQSGSTFVTGSMPTDRVCMPTETNTLMPLQPPITVNSRFSTLSGYAMHSSTTPYLHTFVFSRCLKSCKKLARTQRRCWITTYNCTVPVLRAGTSEPL
ncbi:hypothetical protein EDD15DRAFT_2229156 [Pisolithus albus]|nr:hypothetical protein EDD15DRAFT_2229156 [Pisolithus albus]